MEKMSFEEALDEVCALSDTEILGLPSDKIFEDVFATVQSTADACASIT